MSRRSDEDISDTFEVDMTAEDVPDTTLQRLASKRKETACNDAASNDELNAAKRPSLGLEAAMDKRFRAFGQKIVGGEESPGRESVVDREGMAGKESECSESLEKTVEESETPGTLEATGEESGIPDLLSPDILSPQQFPVLSAGAASDETTVLKTPGTDAETTPDMESKDGGAKVPNDQKETQPSRDGDDDEETSLSQLID